MGDDQPIDFDNLTLADLGRIFDVPFVFWVCPKGCRGFVDWNESSTVATCRECGERSGVYPDRAARK